MDDQSYRAVVAHAWSNGDPCPQRPMTETPAPDAAVQIVAETLDDEYTYASPAEIRAVCDTLARAGWLHDPARVAALEAVAEAARPFRAKQRYEYWLALDRALIALDAVPATTSDQEPPCPTTP